MIYLFFTYFIYIALIIIKNYKNRRVIWLSIMFAGFCISFLGLAFYTEFISNDYNSSNKLFEDISKYIWKMNYYLKIDMFQDIRILNIGVFLYIYGAVCFPLSYIKKKPSTKRIYILIAILAATMCIILDPQLLMKILNLQKSYLNIPIQYLKIYPEIMKITNFVANYLIKSGILVSTGIIIYLVVSSIPILRNRFIYIFLGIIPVHILFFVLFYQFPNNTTIVVYNYSQLNYVNLTYNRLLYHAISYIAFFSIILQIYAIFRYNILETSIKKSRITFQHRLDTANIAMKVFSHSIKNQFITIRLLSEQLAKTGDNKPNEVILNEITSICSSSVDRLSSLFRETKTGVIKLKYEHTDIVELIDPLVKKFEKSNPSITFSIEGKAGICLNLDKKQFEKVLENIIMNSAEACEKREDSMIAVKIGEVHDFISIMVWDNGKGIEKKYIGRVFEPFFSTKPMASNWGIGLSFCQKVIEAFGGVISVSSNPGEGTTIRIYIPSEPVEGI